MLDRHKMFVVALIIAVLLSACGSVENHKGHKQDSRLDKQAASGVHNHHDPKELGDNIHLEWSFQPSKPKPGEEFDLVMEVQDSEGRSVGQIDEYHQKKMHLIVVSKDLSRFYHLHPEYEGKGVFRQKATFAAGGQYKLFADFVPSGHGQVTASSSLTLEGAAEHQPLIADQVLIKLDRQAEVSLSLGSMQAGEELELTFSFADPKSGEAITDHQSHYCCDSKFVRVAIYA